jgi:seryl-tRNA synthetase
MAKTIAEKSIELATANAELLSKVSGLEAVNAQITAQIETIKAEQTASCAKITELTVAVEAAKGEAAAVVVERDAFKAEAEKLAKTLALSPEIKQSAGTDAVAGSDVSANDGPQTWVGAVAACGGDYVKARAKYPDLHKKTLDQAKQK